MSPRLRNIGERLHLPADKSQFEDAVQAATMIWAMLALADITYHCDRCDQTLPWRWTWGRSHSWYPEHYRPYQTHVARCGGECVAGLPFYSGDMKWHLPDCKECLK